jgi:hypothetical protein
MRYKLRTLLIVLAVGPPMLAGVGWIAREYYLAYESFMKSLDAGHPNEMKDASSAQLPPVDQ